jgi:glutamyl/glutaminyl-tRNA synthetase
MFEEACSQFIVESEGITISKLKRAASRPAVPAKHKPNPVNEAYAREEAQLKKTLERFNAEEQEWHRVRATPVSATPQPTFALLPPAGSMPASSHVLMNELSIADRNLLSNSTGKDSELSELLAWAHGYIHCGLDKPRQALASVEERSENLQQQHSKLIQSTRSAVRAPFASAPANPKELLRALAAS